jgi:hypothetical protein
MEKPFVLEVLQIKYVFSGLHGQDNNVDWSMIVEMTQGFHEETLVDQTDHIDMLRFGNAFTADTDGNVAGMVDGKHIWVPPPGILIWQDQVSMRLEYANLSATSTVKVWLYYREIPVTVPEFLLLRRLL